MNNQKTNWDERLENISLNRKQSQYAEEKELLFPRNSTVCDIGGGSGIDSLYFLKKGHRVILIDLSNVGINKAVEKAKKEGLLDKLEVCQMNIGERQIPLQNSSIDIIYSRLFLHYFSFDKTIKILKDFYRILKINGTAYIAVKSPEDKAEFSFLKSTAKELGESLFDDNGQIKSRFTKEQWKQILKQAVIVDFSVDTYIDKISCRNDEIKSGNKQLILNDIIFTK